MMALQIPAFGARQRCTWPLSSGFHLAPRAITTIPLGSTLSLLDPYQEEESHWGRYVLAVVLLAAAGAAAYWYFVVRAVAP